jgi:hypothetical protein
MLPFLFLDLCPQFCDFPPELLVLLNQLLLRAEVLIRALLHGLSGLSKRPLQPFSVNLGVLKHLQVSLQVLAHILNYSGLLCQRYDLIRQMLNLQILG